MSERAAKAPQPIEIDTRWSRASFAAGDDCPAVLEVGITARRAEGETAAKVPAEIALVLDVSGSMNAPERYPLVEQAVGQFLMCLDEADRAAIFAFSETGEQLAGLTEGRRLAPVWPGMAVSLRCSPVFYGGPTNLSAGLLPAVAELRLRSRPEAVRRVHVLTDGELHDIAACEALARDLAGHRIELQVHGFGRGFDPEQLSGLVRGVPGGLLKPLVDTRRVLDVFRHLADTSGRIALRNVKIDVRFAPGVIAGDVFSLAPARRWLGAVEGGAFSAELFSMELDRFYAWVFELRLPEAGVGTATAALVSVLGEQGDAARHASLDVAVERTDGHGARDPDVERDRALVAAERDDDPETRVRALEARLSLCRDEGRDPALIAALERKLAALTGGGGDDDTGDDGGDGFDGGFLPPPSDDELYIGCAESSVQIAFPEELRRLVAEATAQAAPAPAAEESAREVRVLVAAADEVFRGIIEAEIRAALEPGARVTVGFAGSADEMAAAGAGGRWDLLVVLVGDVRTSRFHGRARRVTRTVEAAGDFSDATGAAVIALAEESAETGDLDRLAGAAGFAAFSFVPWDGQWLRDAVRRAAEMRCSSE